MADPAIEAGNRVFKQFSELANPTQYTVAAAREALKPVRELHTPYTVSEPDGEWSFCAHSHNSWPCETAKLIYTTEELAQ